VGVLEAWKQRQQWFIEIKESRVAVKLTSVAGLLYLCRCGGRSTAPGPFGKPGAEVRTVRSRGSGHQKPTQW